MRVKRKLVKTKKNCKYYLYLIDNSPFFLVKVYYRNTITRRDRRIYFCEFKKDKSLDRLYVSDVVIERSNLIVTTQDASTVLKYAVEKDFTTFLLNIYEALPSISRLFYYRANKDSLNYDRYSKKESKGLRQSLSI